MRNNHRVVRRHSSAEAAVVGKHQGAGRAAAEPLNHKISREAFALVVTVFGLVSLSSLLPARLLPGYEVHGAVTAALYRSYTLWFGVLNVIPPLVISFAGVMLLLGRDLRRFCGRAAGLYLLLFAISSYMQMWWGRRILVGDIYVGPAGLFGQFNHDLLIPGLFDRFGGCFVLGLVGLLGLSLLFRISPVGAAIVVIQTLLHRIERWRDDHRWTMSGFISRLGSIIVLTFRAAGRMLHGWWRRASTGRMRIRRTGSVDRSAAHAEPSGSQLSADGRRRPAAQAPEAQARSEPADGCRQRRPTEDPAPSSDLGTAPAGPGRAGVSVSTEDPHEPRNARPEPVYSGGAGPERIRSVREAASSVDEERPQQLGLFADDEMKQLPPLSLLDSHPLAQGSGDSDQSELLLHTLDSFGVSARIVNRMVGPVVTRYELQPAPGVPVRKIVSLSDDIALALAAGGIRIEAPIPGKAAIGIEIPNKEPALVGFREMVESPEFRNAKSKLTVVLGKDIAGRCIVGDLGKMVHLLVAGATGSGKSVCLNTLIASLLYKATPDEVKLLMVDPKRVEFTSYDGLPHLMAPVVTDPKKAAGYLLWVVEQMENRYKLFGASGVRNIERYNQLCAASKGTDAETPPLPYYVVILDELADLMMVAKNEVEASINRLAFMARAAGIHLVIATQRPSVDVVTGVIKANIPSRIAFAVSSGIDSRIILDTVGAEKLQGRGDMLYLPSGASKPIRAQCAYVSDDEIIRIVNFLKETGRPEYHAESREIRDTDGPEDEDSGDDELFREAVRLVVETGQASASMLQRRFRIGYSRAGRLIDTMEVKGIIGPHEGSKPRKILLENGEWQKWLPRDAASIQPASERGDESVDEIASGDDDVID